MAGTNNVVISSRVRLARNAANVPFKERLTGGGECEQLIILADKAMGTLPHKTVRVKNMSEVEKLSFIEQHLVSKDLFKTDDSAIVYTDDKKLSVMVNEEDHFRLQCILPGYELDTAYESVNALDDKLEKLVDYAYDDKLGYLTSCPTNLGTGMRASVMAFLPALTISGHMKKMIAYANKSGIIVRGLYGEGTEAIGYTYQISNQISLGYTERDLIDRLKEIVGKISDAERAVRERLYVRDKIGLQDEIMRAYGVLRYAVKMTSDEFIGLVSKVKLGVLLGILDIPLRAIDELIEYAQPATLCRHSGKLLGENERDAARAELIRNALAVASKNNY